MTQTQIPGEDVARRGKALYQTNIRSQVEIPENIGKLVSIDVETGNYEIGDDLIATSRQLHAKRPAAATEFAIWTERIGFDAVYAIGGTLARTSSCDREL